MRVEFSSIVSLNSRTYKNKPLLIANITITIPLKITHLNLRKIIMKHWHLLNRLWLTALLAVPSISLAKVYEYELDNGLKILVKQDRRAPVVVAQVWYKVGGSYEYDGITGISHVLEHMMFKGTEKYPNGTFSRIISENGGQDNAFTGQDYTTYFQTLEKSRLAISLQLESDRMRHLTLPEQEFIKELEVVKEERRWRTEDKPQAFLYEAAMATAYQTSSYRYPVVGWMKDLDNMTIADVRDWYKKWYAPNNATLVVVGDVEPEAVQALAKKYFAALPKNESIAPKLPQEVSQQGIKQVTVKRPANIPYLMMLYKVPVFQAGTAKTDWEPYALEVLVGILDGGRSARFASRLIRDSEVATSASANYQVVSRLKNVLILAGTPAESKQIDQLEQAFRQEIMDLQTKPVDEKELQRVKAQVISSDIYEKDSIFYQAYIIGLLETIGLSWRFAEDYVERVRAITATQVMMVAKKYLIDDRLTVAKLDPLPLTTPPKPPAGSDPHAR